MTKRAYCYLLLTCNAGEETKIAQTLLDKRLIACAKFVPVSAMYWWQGEVASENEVAIVMETAEDLYDEIETAVAAVHSYDTFVLTQIPMTRINSAAETWLSGEIKPATQ